MPDPDPDDTQPAESSDDRPAAAALLPEVVARRKQVDEQARRIGPSIDAHIAEVMQSCRIALEALASQHAYSGDNSDLDLDGEDVRIVVELWRRSPRVIDSQTVTASGT
jgi:hypothetical protein